MTADSKYCLTCGSDKSVKLWNPHRALFLKAYTGHGHEVLDAQGSGDNSQICSGGMDKTVVLFDVSSGQALRKYRGHAGELCFLNIEILNVNFLLHVHSNIVFVGELCFLYT